MQNPMDIIRESNSRKQRIRRIALVVVGLVLVSSAFLGLSQLRPAAPTVDRTAIWTDTVRRGTMLRQVRGLGTLVPEEIWWISSTVDARVQRILVQPGTVVTASTVLIELSNPELEQEALESEWQLKAAIAELRNLEVQLQSQKLDREAILATVRAENVQAQLRSETDKTLNSKGLSTSLETKGANARAEELAERYAIEQKRLDILGESSKAQMAVQRSRIEQLRALVGLRRARVEAMHVRAGIDGVLQQLPVQVGQQVIIGTTLAKVAQSGRLKAQLRVAETQAKDVQTGLSVVVDTRNGIIDGTVSRIDPAVQNGTVTVDVELTGTLPKGARPDLTVDGTIELERLQNVLYIGRPAQIGDGGTVGLFKIDPDNAGATRVEVKLGRSSVSTIEVMSGIREGDRIILSDMSSWDGEERVELR
jgi:HlyD family secretion protein